MADKRVIFYSDNAAVVDIINKQTSKDKTTMVLLRDLVLSCLKHNILFQARHIPGFINSRADYLSRSQVTKFKKISPDADKFPTQVPENLMPRSWFLRYQCTPNDHPALELPYRLVVNANPSKVYIF